MASRIAEAARSTYPEVVNLSIGGWRLSDNSAAEMAQDIAGVLEDEYDGSHTLVLHLVDNAIFKGEVNGELADPIKINGTYHIKGKLRLVDSATFKLLFESALPILRACSASNIILLVRAPAALHQYKMLLGSSSHHKLRQQGVRGEHGQRDQGSRQSAPEPGSYREDQEDQGDKSSGPDGGHGLGRGSAWRSCCLCLGLIRTNTGYNAIAGRLADELETPHVVHVRSLTAPKAASGSGGAQPPPRESRTAGTQIVAHRNTHLADNGGQQGYGRGGTCGSGRTGRSGRGGSGGRWGRGGHRRGGFKPY